jgi:hypothetical protein
MVVSNILSTTPSLSVCAGLEPIGGPGGADGANCRYAHQLLDYAVAGRFGASSWVYSQIQSLGYKRYLDIEAKKFMRLLCHQETCSALGLMPRSDWVRYPVTWEFAYQLAEAELQHAISTHQSVEHRLRFAAGSRFGLGMEKGNGVERYSSFLLRWRGQHRFFILALAKMMEARRMAAVR